MRALYPALVVALIPIVGLTQAPARQQPQEPVATFRAGVRAIQVDAVVTDEDGNPVRRLTADDFEITERGVPQPITTFEAVVTTIGSMSRSSDELKKSGELLHFEAPLPLMNLPPGRYVVSVEASSTAGGEPISRSVPFRVR